jgi:hypothetical protein
MKKALFLAACSLLSACVGNDTRNIRTVIEANPGSEVKIKNCSVFIGREIIGDGSTPRWGTYTNDASLVVSNRSPMNAPVRARLVAVSKDGSVLSDVFVEGIAKAGTTTKIEGWQSVPAPINFVEERDFIVTDLYKCSL